MSRSTLLLLLCLLSSTLAPAQVPASVDLKKLDAYFANAQKSWGVPGMSIGIVKDGKVVFAKGYGVATQGTATPVDEKTLYAIASNSKAFTSAIIGMLVQEGKLSWDDKVKDHLPYFTLPDRYAGDHATLRDILSHRVGLGTFSGDIVWYNSNFSSEEIIRRIPYLPTAYPFRAGYGYSNLMYITAGEIIKKVTGKSWYENVKERILDPLNMSRTVVDIAKVPALGNAASPHALLRNTTHQPIAYTSWEEIAATGGLISSVEDLCKWMIFNLNNGTHGRDTLLTPRTRTTLWTVHNAFAVDRTKSNDFGSTFAGYGLGWGLRDYHGHLKVSHTGGYDGMITSVSLLPDQKLGVVVLTNGLKAPINALAHYTFDAFLGRPANDWSLQDLDKANQAFARDTRVADLKAARLLNTRPTQPLSAYAGTYHTPVYGNMTVTENNGTMEIAFEHTPNLDATLSHWHHDTFQLHWKKDHPWFTFGTVKFSTDNNQRVTGISFEVPNDDFWFEELNARKLK
jgi:CubicO group peptidase (beta-lactamase class C family)